MRQSAEKGSRKVKDKEQTKVNAEKRKVKDKVHEQVTVESSDSDNKTQVLDVAEVRTLGNVKVIAIEDYVAQNRDELTLKAGQKIKQKIPANSDGMAYGWIWKSRKIYGYYPANLVELKPKKENPGIRGILSKKSGSLMFAS
ncbi:hypothetical protein CHS0354_010197 [Potamilus streckersoni]|uniref:SH3 domain-containing protein n=1 Tax=Potamilus streckersoni TaxID=2493646 RepID=A0AAE0RSL5_9BIVA|nr:hypothetical protein CHS0354_010197 [Potamilus streckersoni]